MSISRLVDKTTLVHLHDGILLCCKKEENFTICDSMVGPGEHYAKWNKSIRERQIPDDLIYMGNPMNWTNKQNRDRLIESRMTAKVGDSDSGWRDWAKKKKDPLTQTVVWWLQDRECRVKWVEVEEDIRGINGNGKNTIKINKFTGKKIVPRVRCGS